VAKKTSLLPRGFKANAERTALGFRKTLELEPHAPLCGFKLAEHLKIPVFPATEIFPEQTNLDELVGTKNKDKGWSALTMKTAKNNTIIIHNHLHAPTRQQSNLMHELAHVICKHEQPATHKNIALPFFMREYDKQQEEEANYLGSVLQITREGLIWTLKKRMEISEIAEYFNASTAMVTLRINSTGVKQQLSYLNR
jgi:hypothetical protein